MTLKTKRILIVTGGKKDKLDSFKEAIKKSGLDVVLASFSEIEYYSGKKDLALKIQGVDLALFDLIYIRMVGKRLEDATLLANYAKQKGIRIVDSLYETSLLMPASVSKAMEMKLFAEAKVPIPPTFFGSLRAIDQRAAKLLGFPLIIKSTTGKKARDVWAPKTQKELKELVEDLVEQEEDGKRFFAQKFIKASQRVRVLVVGKKAIGAITRPTKWRKRFIEKVKGEYPEGKKEAARNVPENLAEFAAPAAAAVKLDIAGVDILVEDKTDVPLVIEANAAPSWKLVARDANINVESVILDYLDSLMTRPSSQVKKQYQKRFKTFGADPKSLSWKELGASHQRFRQMWAEIDFNDKGVLDVGSGFGEMAKFLLKRYKGVVYTGVDIVPEFIARARELYPDLEFIERDYLENPLDRKFDIVLASGLLNSNVKNNSEYRKKAIKTMFSSCKEVFAFNMLGGYPQPKTPKDSNVWYADSLEVLEYCLTLTRRVILRANYHPRDFTIFMYPVKKKGA